MCDELDIQFCSVEQLTTALSNKSNIKFIRWAKMHLHEFTWINLSDDIYNYGAPKDEPNDILQVMLKYLDGHKHLNTTLRYKTVKQRAIKIIDDAAAKGELFDSDIAFYCGAHGHNDIIAHIADNYVKNTRDEQTLYLSVLKGAIMCDNQSMIKSYSIHMSNRDIVKYLNSAPSISLDTIKYFGNKGIYIKNVERRFGLNNILGAMGKLAGCGYNDFDELAYGYIIGEHIGGLKSMYDNDFVFQNKHVTFAIKHQRIKSFRYLNKLPRSGVLGKCVLLNKPDHTWSDIYVALVIDQELLEYKNDKRVMESAFRICSLEDIKYLVRLGFDTDVDINYMLCRRDIKFAKYALDELFGPGKPQRSQKFYIFPHDKDYELLKRMLLLGLRVSDSVLFAAIKTGYTDVIDLFLDHGYTLTPNMIKYMIKTGDYEGTSYITP